jgi:NitT/TauT family transport system substrate-binding protein
MMIPRSKKPLFVKKKDHGYTAIDKLKMKNRAGTIILLICFLWPAVTITTNTAYAEDKVTYRLKWLYNVSVVGALYANVHHLFDHEGFSVTLKSGGPELDAIRELELGHADFGEASADQVIRAKAKGSPVVVIAQLFQINPLQWIYRPEEVHIQTLSDLKGKVIGVTFGGNDETIMRTLLVYGRITDSEVKLFSVRYDYTPFYQHKVQLWPVYRNAQGPIISDKLERAGEKVKYFDPSAFGVKFVSNSVVTMAQTLAEKPDLVKRFLQALLEGWQQALAPENKEIAVRTLQQFDQDTPRKILETQLEITRELVQPTPDFIIGGIDEKAWQQTEKIMLDQHQIEKPVNIKTILTPQVKK